MNYCNTHCLPCSPAEGTLCVCVCVVCAGGLLVWVGVCAWGRVGGCMCVGGVDRWV